MPNRSRRSLCTVLFLLTGIVRATAENTDAPKCGEGIQLIREYATAYGPMFDGFEFQKDDNAVIILVLLRSSINAKVRKWALLVRPPNEPTGYCVAAKGEGVGQLADMHNNNSEKRFGMPGSGEPRCSSNNEPVGSLAVRWWANRELGESTIMYTESSTSNDYMYLISKDNNWIIIKSQHDQALTSCYLNRGQSVKIYLNEHFVDK